MKREDILAAALLRQPHPRYGLLTAGKNYLLQHLENPLIMRGAIEPGSVEQAWAVCILDYDDPAVTSALEDGGAALEEFWREAYHPSEFAGFIAWFDEQHLDAQAAATEDKPDKRAGKPEEEPEQPPTG